MDAWFVYYIDGLCLHGESALFLITYWWFGQLKIYPFWILRPFWIFVSAFNELFWSFSLGLQGVSLFASFACWWLGFVSLSLWISYIFLFLFVLCGRLFSLASPSSGRLFSLASPPMVADWIAHFPFNSWLIDLHTFNGGWLISVSLLQLRFYFEWF